MWLKRSALAVILSQIVFVGNAQDLIRERSVEYREGYSNPSSSIQQHLIKQGITYSFEEYACNLNCADSTNFYFTVNQQADLIYFEKYETNNNSRQMIESGYYRLVYMNEEYGYCWTKDLVWMFFEDNILVNKKFYHQGDVMESFINVSHMNDHEH
ncbi:MAG: hypothetical protein H6548_06885 [Chitinophagales bacterium]|nr:hypothetical protein [Chitinophagales bacterium]MCB9030922.1 hypothetical protein [Chitinophagales bacterium]HQU40502.1 hypothetical protein [Chitinophagales bacterium]